MALSESRIAAMGETPHAYEREAIDFAISAIPNNDPHLLWGLVDLLDPATGRLYEIDLLVLGHAALYLVEIKSGPGIYTGDSVDWHRGVEGGKRVYLEAPYRLTNHKAKVLASRLRARMADVPWVQPLVFLSHKEAEVRLSPEGRVGVVQRRDLARAITHHDFPGRDPLWTPRPINAPQRKNLLHAMQEIGIKQRKGQAHVGPYELGAIVGEGEGTQDRIAVHRDTPKIQRRARVYLIPQETSAERRSVLRRAADRDARILYDVREHPSILRFTDFFPETPVGPTILFDAFDGALPLDTFLRQNPEIRFDRRIELLRDVAHALAFCHRKSVVHGALGPEAVLVRRAEGASDPNAPLDIRLHGFQLGSGDEITPTVHRAALFSERSLVYQAPELAEDPSSAGPLSDIFGLGALAYLVLTGKPPAANAIDLAARLRRDGCLDPRAAGDSVPEKVAELVRWATCVSFANRADAADLWADMLLAEVTAPAEAAATVDPLEAGKDTPIDHDLTVIKTLGHGATSRVLEVERASDGRHLALKVALSPEYDARFEEEARALQALRHPRIVQLIEQRRIGGRLCLLLSIAGEHTLQQQLTREGTVILDYAIRYGEELLSALENLEDKAIIHRDIKPANLGVGSPDRKTHHLVLFDFSLAFADVAQLEVGTAAYRDPFLPLRGRWDAAADRWSAAVTMHEMLTGVRPSYGGARGTALDPEAPLVLAAERFEPALRAELTAFFSRALARDVAARFPTAEAMRRAWLGCFHTSTSWATSPLRGLSIVAAPASEERDEPDSDPAPSPAVDLTRLGPDTPIAALPLSLRAQNALDRAGLTHASDILRLPDNRLSVLRGVGTRVADEILAFRDRWRAAFAASIRAPIPASAPFFPGYRGEDLPLLFLQLDDKAARALRDIGVRSLAALASAPEHQIANLATRHGFDRKALHALLDAEHRRAEARAQPVTVEGWIDALIPARTKRDRHARILFGLDPLPNAAPDPLGLTVSAAAKALGVTPAAISIAVGKCRDRWRKHPAIGELSALCHRIVADAKGALPLDQAAEGVLAAMPFDRALAPEIARAEASALIRIIIETERAREGDEAEGRPTSNTDGGLTLLRLRALWVCETARHAAVVRALGEAADKLAASVPLAGSAEIRRALGDLVAGSSLADLAPERLVALAASAGARAACSSRLELYPTGMPAARALELTAPILIGTLTPLTPDDVKRRVAGRYPDAEPIPDRPALDALLDPLGLRWTGDAYQRPGDPQSSSLHTTISSLHRVHTALPTQPRAMTEEAIEAREFDDRLRHAVERKAFRVLAVHADQAALAAKRLAERLSVAPIELDRELLREMERQGASKKVKPDALHAADREGPAGRSWKHVVKLAELAAGVVQRRLLPPKAPLLLVQPGLVSRYKLTGFLDALIAASKRDDAEAIFLLVPAHDQGGVPAINGALQIPGVLAQQRLSVSREWLRNAHNAAAERV